jgi:4-amino-4-deoxy-L-arabinose transferase-like glycosyltransferase
MLRAVLPGIPARSSDLFVDVVVTSSSATFSALAAALVFWIFCGLGIDTRTATLAALMLALGTPLFAYSAWFFSEPLAAALLLGAALTLFAGRRQQQTIILAALAGVILGVAVWVRPAHVIAVPVFFLALLLRDREKSILPAITLAAVVALFGGAYLLRNQIYFGNPMDFGYPEVAEGGKHLNSFETPLATGLYGFLLSPGKSIFLFAPLLLLAIPGVFKVAKRNIGLAIVAGGTPLIYLLFFARYTQWEGGYCVGPRYLVPAIALLCLGLGPVIADATPAIRKLAVVLFAAGMLVQVISVATSFMEDQATGKYYDTQWNYRMDYSSIPAQTRLLLHYLASSKPARMNFGHDRWFVFLAKGGVSRGVLAAGIVFELAGLVFFFERLRKALAELADSGNPHCGNLSANMLAEREVAEPAKG